MSVFNNKNFMTTSVFAVLLLLLLNNTNAFLQPSSIPVSAAASRRVDSAPSVGTMTSTDATPYSSKPSSALRVMPPLFDGSGVVDDLDLIGSSQRILSGMAHVTLDFSTLLGSGATIFRRSVPVFGRIFVMAADYIPDHTIHTEELLVQVFMMGVALKDLANAVQQEEEETQSV